MSTQWLVWRGFKEDRFNRSVYLLEDRGFTSQRCAATFFEGLLCLLSSNHLATGHTHPTIGSVCRAAVPSSLTFTSKLGRGED